MPPSLRSTDRRAAACAKVLSSPELTARIVRFTGEKDESLKALSLVNKHMANEAFRSLYRTISLARAQVKVENDSAYDLRVRHVRRIVLSDDSTDCMYSPVWQDPSSREAVDLLEMIENLFASYPHLEEYQHVYGEPHGEVHTAVLFKIDSSSAAREAVLHRRLLLEVHDDSMSLGLSFEHYDQPRTFPERWSAWDITQRSRLELEPLADEEGTELRHWCAKSASLDSRVYEIAFQGPVIWGDLDDLWNQQSPVRSFSATGLPSITISYLYTMSSSIGHQLERLVDLPVEFDDLRELAQNVVVWFPSLSTLGLQINFGPGRRIASPLLDVSITDLLQEAWPNPTTSSIKHMIIADDPGLFGMSAGYSYLFAHIAAAFGGNDTSFSGPKGWSMLYAWHTWTDLVRHLKSLPPVQLESLRRHRLQQLDMDPHKLFGSVRDIIDLCYLDDGTPVPLKTCEAMSLVKQSQQQLDTMFEDRLDTAYRTILGKLAQAHLLLEQRGIEYDRQDWQLGRRLTTGIDELERLRREAKKEELRLQGLKKRRKELEEANAELETNLKKSRAALDGA